MKTSASNIDDEMKNDIGRGPPDTMTHDDEKEIYRISSLGEVVHDSDLESIVSFRNELHNTKPSSW